MKEEWRDINGFPGYQVSNYGRVRSFYKKKHVDKGYGTYRILTDKPMILKPSDDGNGYQKVMLYSKKDNRRYCKKVHRLVAEAFLQCSNMDIMTVDHIKSGKIGKLDNSVSNLRWISRRENIQKAYKDGMCDERINRQKIPVIIHDTWSGEDIFKNSVKEAADYIGVDYTSVSHNLNFDTEYIKNRYYCEYLKGEDLLLYDEYFY